jgi:hypothetical protein
LFGGAVTFVARSGCHTFWVVAVDVVKGVSMLNIELLPLLLIIIFVALPLAAWIGIKRKKSVKDINKYLAGTVLIIPIIVTVEYLASKLMGREFILKESLLMSMFIYVGFSFVLWIWFRLFIFIKDHGSQE